MKLRPTPPDTCEKCKARPVAIQTEDARWLCAKCDCKEQEAKE